MINNNWFCLDNKVLECGRPLFFISFSGSLFFKVYLFILRQKGKAHTCTSREGTEREKERMQSRFFSVGPEADERLDCTIHKIITKVELESDA